MKRPQAPEPPFTKSNPHPRGLRKIFARVLGKYCRDEKMLSLPEAIRRLSAQPGKISNLDHRGMLKEGSSPTS